MEYLILRLRVPPYRTVECTILYEPWRRARRFHIDVVGQLRGHQPERLRLS